MKILIVAPGYDSRTSHAVSMFALDQARALQNAGHDVRFAAVDTRSIRHDRPMGFRTYTLDTIPVCYGSLPGGRLPFRLPELVGKAAMSGVWRMAARDGWKPDVVHAHFLGVAAIAAPLCRKERLPLVITEHSSAVNKAELPPPLIRTMQETYQKADAVLAVSHALADNIRRSTGIAASVVPNIADTGCFAVERTAHSGFRFASAGNLIPVKNMTGLLQAFAALPGEPELVIFGGGAEETALRKQSETLGIGNRVTLRGVCPREELAAAYAAADCFVLASRSETFGVAYIEAMAAGLPVIATRCGGPEDFVTEENGLLVPVDDTAALTGAMEHMMLHRTEYDSASIAADIRRKFAPETIAARLTAVYEEIVSC